MTTRPATAVTFFAVLLAMVLATAGFVFTALTWSTPSGDALTPAGPAVGFTIAALTYTVAGALLALKRPTNLIGWLFLLAAVFTALDVAYGRYLLYTLVTAPDSSLPSLVLFGGMANGFWIVPMISTVLVLITFPEGRTPSRAWTAAAVVAVLLGLLAILMNLIEPGPLPVPLDTEGNPLGVGAYEDLMFLFNVVVLGFALVALAGTFSLYRRLQRASGDEREQLKWFAYVAAWLGPVTIGYVIANSLGELHGAVYYGLQFATIVIICALPVAIGIAVLKYRLYDIDIIVNRTLVYVPLTAILAGLFTANIGLSRAIFTEVSGAGSDSAVALSTLAVVALFTPVKNQLQAVVDSYFKEPSDPSRPLKKLAQDARPVLSVLETRAFLQDFLDRATSAIDARGCALVLEGAAEPLLTSGDSDLYVLAYPLAAADAALGSFNVGASRSGKPYTLLQVETIEKETDVLARAFELYLRSGGESKRPSHLENGSDAVSAVEAPGNGAIA